MPTITLLELTMSKNSKGVIAAEVTYTLEFSDAEIAADITFTEHVVLVRRVGLADVYSTPTLPGPAGGVQLVVTQIAGDTPDAVVAVLADTTTRFGDLGVGPAAPAAVDRAYKHVLSADELAKLVERGREHPYVYVAALPTGISADVQIAAVDIDVDDPEADDTFSVIAPGALAFDGTNIWVTSDGGTITRLARDGTNVSTTRIGARANSMIFDGANLWVADSNMRFVLKIRTSDGNIVGSAQFDSIPVGVAFDGTNIWVANISPHNVVKLDLTADIIATFPLAHLPAAIAVNDAVWIANGDDPTITKLDSADGHVVGTFPVSGTPTAIAASADTIWVGNENNSVDTVRSADGTVTNTYPVAVPSAIALTADYAWLTSRTANTVTGFSTTGGPAQFHPTGNGPVAVVVAGPWKSVWVANHDAGSVSKIVI
jgi:hypothetical protein